jgi:histone H4
MSDMSSQQPAALPQSSVSQSMSQSILSGKGGKLPSKGKRHKIVPKDVMLGIKKSNIRRICRRGGVKRISARIYEEVRGVAKSYLENVVQDSLAYTEHAKRKTITAQDVIYAFNRQGIKLYGFNER